MKGVINAKGAVSTARSQPMRRLETAQKPPKVRWRACVVSVNDNNDVSGSQDAPPDENADGDEE